MFGNAAQNLAINAIADQFKKKLAEVNPAELEQHISKAFTHEIEQLRAADTDGNHVDDLTDCEKDAAIIAEAFGRIARKLQAVHAQVQK